MAYLKRVGNGSCTFVYTTPLSTRLSIPLSFIFRQAREIGDGIMGIKKSRICGIFLWALL